MDDKYYNNIKQYLIENESTKLAKEYSKNKSDLNTNFEVGRELTLAGKHYGESIINKYSIKLSDELGKGYTPTRLRYYRRFFEVVSKCPTLSDKLSYSHYCEIIKEATVDEIKQYFDNKHFKKKDVVDISVDTAKEDELFDYVGYPRYYGVPKYNELDDDYEYNKNKDDDFDLSL